MQEEDKKLLQIFGEHFKHIRMKRASLNKFALNETSVSTATVSRIENGISNFKFVTFIKLAFALKMTPSELLKDIEFDYTDYE